MLRKKRSRFHKEDFSASSPYAPKEQQIEGMKWIASVATIWQYERALNTLVANKFLSKAQKKKYLTRFRKHIGLHYEQWKALRRTARVKPREWSPYDTLQRQKFK